MVGSGSVARIAALIVAVLVSLPLAAHDTPLPATPEIDAQIDFERIDYRLLHEAVFAYTNVERVERGLPALEHHPALEEAAHEHSRAMRDRRFFSHTSPVDGRRTVADRIQAAGAVASGWGENIAISFGIAYRAGRGVYNPEQNGGYFSYEYRGEPIPPHTYRSFARAVVAQWMGSPGHRANILRRTFRYLGVGAAHFRDASFYGMDKFYVTQNFAGTIR